MIRTINSIAEKYSRLTPWTNVYGLARSILAFGTLLVLLSNDDTILFFNISSILASDSVSFRNIGLFYLLGDSHLAIAKLIATIILVLVVIGWRPRITGICHWWVSYSFFSICPIVDGGDQITSILTLLLIPVCLTDERKNHWINESIISNDNWIKFTKLFVWSVFLVIRIQVSLIYFHAGIAKLNVTEWINGTATYYWFTHPIHGVSVWLKPVVISLMSNPYVVVSVTWGTIIFEILLAACLFMRRESFTYRFFLFSAILFHFGIAIIFGLISFFCAMTAALILFLYPMERKSPFSSLKGRFLRFFKQQSKLKPKTIKSWSIDSPNY